MATYYRWIKSEVRLTLDYHDGQVSSRRFAGRRYIWLSQEYNLYYKNDANADLGHGYIALADAEKIEPSDLPITKTGVWYWSDGTSPDDENSGDVYSVENPRFYVEENDPEAIWVETTDGAATIRRRLCEIGPGDFVEYVYSTSSSAYPNNKVSGDYFYGNSTTVTSPTAPSGLTCPNPITTSSATVSWSAATSNVPDYPVNRYELSYSVNGGSSWTVAGTTAGTSLEVDIPAGTTSIRFRVRARDSNGQWGSYSTSSTAVPVYLAPTLTVPQILMQGQQASVNWTAIEGADSYTLERKSSADADWTQVYSGTSLTYSETAGTWTTVQYRVQAVFDGTPGGWATSAEIPVVSASALVISGQDGDLGTLVNDVPYTISTDTGNQITATITANGAVIFSGNVGNSAAGVIPVLDLINGAGTIVIEASVTASSGPVSAVRTWTYTKDLITFPNAGSVAQLTQDGKDVFPKTLAEAVRIPGGKTLDQVMGFPCQIYTGSYVGTGTYGQSNPNELTFPFTPKLWGVIGSEKEEYYDVPQNWLLIPWGYTNKPVEWAGTGQIIASYTENTVSYYSNTGASAQNNTTGYVYYYVAIG